MPLPITMQDVARDLDTARAYIQSAASETDPEIQRNKALIAAAAAQMANAEATWLLMMGQTMN